MPTSRHRRIASINDLTISAKERKYDLGPRPDDSIPERYKCGPCPLLALSGTFGEMSAMSARDPKLTFLGRLRSLSASLWRDSLAHTTRPLCCLAPQRAQS